MKLALAAAFVFVVSAADAACFGTGAFRSCTDDSGNSYTINRLGNSTYMNGHNARTGSTWNQNSNTFGNTTIHNGRDSSGNSWNVQENRFGNVRTWNGYDSRGNRVNRTCIGIYCN